MQGINGLHIKVPVMNLFLEIKSLFFKDIKKTDFSHVLNE